ncbi:alpha/beta hydrolase [Paenibacillus senegalensis]|uniref:alpha/beta hydrolase n=1 Tax=Paenibacillus senegalensis TaxID=1465766 RepID=UPI000312C7B3|nr:alpha/beta fold hydrolase [Paenibacillus senegalensis]
MTEDRACLLLHGFTGGPYEVKPLAHHLMNKGCCCVTPELPGHNGNLRNLKNYTRYDWIEAAEKEAQKLVQQFGSIDLVGFSMGGLLAAHLATLYPVRRLVLLGTPIIYVSPARLFKDVTERLAKRDLKFYNWKKQTPLQAVFEFMRLVKELKGDLGKIEAPTLIIHGQADPIVHPYSSKYIYERIQAPKELVVLPNSKHLLCLEAEAEALFCKIEAFLEPAEVTVPV